MQLSSKTVASQADRINIVRDLDTSLIAHFRRQGDRLGHIFVHILMKYTKKCPEWLQTKLDIIKRNSVSNSHISPDYLIDLQVINKSLESNIEVVQSLLEDLSNRFDFNNEELNIKIARYLKYLMAEKRLLSGELRISECSVENIMAELLLFRYALPPISIDYAHTNQYSINVDQEAIIWALFNLYKNAENATNVLISFRLEQTSLIIQVVDDGQGIPSDLLKMYAEKQVIFFPWSSTTRVNAHKPITNGLPEVYRIVSLHGGSIKIESTVKVGTTVRIILPILDISS